VVGWRARASVDWRGREDVVEADFTVLEPRERVASWSGLVDPQDPAWPRSGVRRSLDRKLPAPLFHIAARSQLEQGAVSIAAEPLLLAPGQRMTGTVSVTPPKATKANGLIVAIGYVVAGPEEQRVLLVNGESEGLHAQEDVPVASTWQRGRLSLAAAERREFPFELELPEGVPPTSRSPNSTLRWYLLAWLPEGATKGYAGVLPVGVYTAPR
jgi:hypothetical protein